MLIDEKWQKAKNAAASVASVDTRNISLVADRALMRTFLETIFLRCGDAQGYLVLRALETHGERRVCANEWVAFPEGVLDRAAAVATNVAARKDDRRAVFSPPVCIFGDGLTKDGKRFSGDSNVAYAPAIAVDLDKHPSQSLAALVAIIGQPTLVVASGGVWEGEDKLHAYWRLGSPATSEQEKALLKQVRQMAALLIDGDDTAATLSHPMRWPGSWHTKSTPRLCTITDLGDKTRDVKLEWAAEQIASALEQAGKTWEGRAGSGSVATGRFKTIEPLPAKVLEDAARIIPNRCEWSEWNKTAMAFYDASHGSIEGYEALSAWSQKSEKYTPEGVEERWAHYPSSPPKDLSAGTLLHRIRENELDYQPSFDVSAWYETFPVGDETASDWPEPLDIFGDEDPMELGIVPDEALPPIIGPFARSEARRKGVSLAFAAAAAIGVTAAAIGASLRIQVKQLDTGWTEPAPMWLALVADPGRVKTPTIGAATRPLQEIDDEFFRAFKARHDIWNAAAQAHKKRKDAPPPGDEPIMRRITVDNTTFEKQARIHADNPRGLLRTPDELMGFFGSFGAYKASGDGDRTEMLRLFDGGPIMLDRVGAGSIRAEQALMGIVAGTQPEKIAKAVRDLGADGMLQRFLFILDDGKARKSIDEAPDDRAAANYRALLRSLATEEYTDVAPLRMDESAQVIFNRTADNIDALKSVIGMPTAWQGHIQKWGKFLPRLVLTFHCVDQIALYGRVNSTLPIDGMSVERAANFARFLLRHSLAFYRQYFDQEPDAAESRWFAGYLLTHPDVEIVTHRTLYDARTSLRGDANRRLRVRILKALESVGWLRTAEQGADGPARCVVNPSIHARFKARTEWEQRDREAKRAAIEKSAEAKRWLSADNMSGKSEVFA